MAEYSHTGILTALLLFTAVTVRDIYLGRTATEQLEQQAAKSSMASDGFLEPNTQRQNKPKFYIGPVLKFQYCKVFQEYSRSISQLYPDIRIHGENYPPKLLNKYIANFISYFKLLAIALIVTGQNPFQMLGANTPRVWSWGQENKRDRGPWLNEGLHCKQLAVGADWMLLPSHTLPLASDALLQTDSISAGQHAISIRGVNVIHELDALTFCF
ncbi:selenoprotein T2 precursor [Silurus meridionalis]|nr:selenoprotein T2 precursor [Silurus meridionalis]